MMEWYEIVLFVKQTAKTALIAPTCVGGPIPEADGVCYASAFTAVGAAFTTMGYWVQSDILDQIIYSGLGLWAPLLYILSAMAGMISLALGRPPQQYLWFFMGPAIFNWLLDTRTEVTGVAWRVADRYQDQREVWKLSEVGLVNTHLFDRIVSMMGSASNASGIISANEAPDLPARTDLNLNPLRNSRDSMVSVAMPFLWFDALISDTVQNLVKWTGIFRQRDYRLTSGPSGSGGSSARSTNINQYSGPVVADSAWFLLSNLKWRYLEDVTGATLANPNIRDAFVTFMASECGDALSARINHASFSAAAHTKGNGIPTSVFKTPTDMFFDYTLLKQSLASASIPTPESLKEVLGDTSPNAFRQSLHLEVYQRPSPGNPGVLVNTTVFDELVNRSSIKCDTYADLLILLFRWEASNIYQMSFVSSSEAAAYTEQEIAYSLLYGWDIKKDRSRPVAGCPTCAGPVTVAIGDGDPLTNGEQIEFIQNLILIHLFRNELAIAPQEVDVSFGSADKTMRYVDSHHRSIGSKSKFGELYTWALMVPYLQGVLFYLLAIGYPFACMLIVMPGMHKVLFTWMSFWVWVKLWDVGFAIVMSLERSVWAMLGNSKQIVSAFDRVVEMGKYGRIEEYQPPCGAAPVSLGGCLSTFYHIMTPPGGSGSAGVYTITAPSNPPSGGFPVSLPDIVAGPPGTAPSFITYTLDQYDTNLRFLDLGMTLAASLQLDLANGYYVYIMAALYMAVPVATGQLVLGAKAGVSSMVSSAIGGASQEASKAAVLGYQGDLVQRLKSNQAGISQTAVAKAYRGSSGLAAGAIEAGNKSAAEGLAASAFGEQASGYGRMIDQHSNNRMGNDSNIQFAANAVSAATGLVSGKAFGSKSAERVPNQNVKQPQTPDSQSDPSNRVSGEFAAQTLTRGSQGKSWGAGIQSMAAQLSQFVDGSGAIALISSAGQARHFDQYADKASELKGKEAESSINAMVANQSAKGHGEHAGRAGAHANYDAQMARWRALNNFANRLGGSGSALGMIAGNLDPGPKPEEMNGMAMSGMLGEPLRQSAGYFDSASGGGFFEAVRSQGASLHGSFGQNPISSIREAGRRSPMELFGKGAAHVPSLFGEINFGDDSDK